MAQMARICDVVFLFVIMLEMEGGQASVQGFRPSAVTAPGDVIIGGLFPIHGGVEKYTNYTGVHERRCVGFFTGGFTLALAMIQAVEAANRSPLLDQLGISLGYHIHDTCSDVSTAIRACADFTQKPTGRVGGANNSSPTTVAVIGAAFSEVSIAVARQLDLGMIPQISYISTAVVLSDKTRFLTFMRTVPNDLYQTRAMVKLLLERDWIWVAMVTTDSDYGRSAMDNFVLQAREAGLCVAFTEILPSSLTSPGIGPALKRVASTLRRNTNVNVVVSFAKGPHMTLLFQELWDQGRGSGSNKSEERVWVASEGWSTVADVLGKQNLADVGHVIGFTFKRSNLTQLQDYLKSLLISDNVTERNTFLNKFYSLLDSEGDANRVLELMTVSNMFSHLILNVKVAVSAVAHAVADICRTRDCKRPDSVQPWEVLGALKKIQFEQEGKSYNFDKNGDINVAYDVTLWRSDKGAVDVNEVMAEYHPNNNSFTYTNGQTKKKLWDLRHVVSKCSDSCLPGQVKKTAEGQHTCCYECINCPENHYSNNTDMDQCQSCDPEREWSSAGSSICLTKTLEFLDWNDTAVVVLITLSALGIVLVVFVGSLFLHARNTPVVRAGGGWLCHVILVSLAGSFASVPLFVGRPRNIHCQVRHVLYGLSFTLCVSCILVKSLKILFAFQFNPVLQPKLRRLYQPFAIISACVVLQAILCTLWLVLKSPRAKVTILPTVLRLECCMGSYAAFGVMLGYIALLALVCFVLAFKGRKLPDKYNEARFISFGMLLYLISWLIFIPVYSTTSGKYIPAVEMVVVLISNYGILSCQFFPKCYCILFRKDYNTQSAFMKSVSDYSGRTPSISVFSCTSSTSSYSESETSSQHGPPSILLSMPTEPAGPQGSLTTLTQNICDVSQSSLDRAFVTGRLTVTRPSHLNRRYSL